MGKRTESLLFKFGSIFGIFTIVTLVISGFFTYHTQTSLYKAEREESIQQIAAYLEDLLVSDGEDFLHYQHYMETHFADMRIPPDFDEDEMRASRKRYEALFSAAQPGKTLGVDIAFDDLASAVQEAYAIYKHELYFMQFEKAREAFDIPYTYYLVPTGEDLHMWWMIDGIRDTNEVDGNEYLKLCDDVEEKRSAHRCMWEAWDTGKRPSGYDTYDNEYGKTYAYYTPLFIGGEKLGVIGVEAEIADVNQAILHNSLRQIAMSAVILVLCVCAMLLFIYRCYISKLERLQASVRTYAQEKNASIATEIERDAVGKDEISVLALQVSSMIMELENYMKNLLSTAEQLRDSQQQTALLTELATKDALTGIRNKTAYDKETARLEWNIADGTAQFGIAMIDLNFLKRINDTFGHEQGNSAIKKLCHIVCHVFKYSPVFRIGGDEFVVVLEHDDYKNVNALVETFNRQLETLANETDLEQWERVSASIGYALYDPALDASVSNVFKRADKAMYAHKKAMKAVRES